MKKIIIFLLTLLPLSTFAQDVWERPQDTKQEVKKPKQNEFNQDDAKYLAGTVPEIDGKVVFTLDLNLPGRSAQDIYERVYAIISLLHIIRSGSSLPITSSLLTEQN